LIVRKTISFIWGSKFESKRRSTICEDTVSGFKPIEDVIQKDIKDSIEAVKSEVKINYYGYSFNR